MQHSDLSVDFIIQKLNLQPLEVEGGLFAQSYLSPETIPPEALPQRYPRQPKPFSTAIYYLLTADADSFSAFHKLLTDEVYHFYLGDSVEMTLFYPDGSSQQIKLGQDILAGEVVQFTVPAGIWQGARLEPGGSYALLGTTMAPGFTPDDFEAASRADLLAKYPYERDRILALTRG